jgi:hypothetical protein
MRDLFGGDDAADRANLNERYRLFCGNHSGIEGRRSPRGLGHDGDRYPPKEVYRNKLIVLIRSLEFLKRKKNVLIFIGRHKHRFAALAGEFF